MTIHLPDIKNGMPGLTPGNGTFLYEGCIVCLARQKHDSIGTELNVDYGNEQMTFTMTWDNDFNTQVDKSYKDQDSATENGACCYSNPFSP